MWIGREYEEIALGDKFIIRGYSRSKAPDPFEARTVSRFTDNFFWLGGRRFSRSYGYEHGSRNNRATKFTHADWNELVAIQEKWDAQQNSEERKAELIELQRREDFGCAHIVDKEAQKFLAMLRFYILNSRKGTQKILDAANDSTSEEPWHLFHALRDEQDWESFRTDVRMADLFDNFHQELVTIADKFEDGVEFKFEIRDTEVMLGKSLNVDTGILDRVELKTVLLASLRTKLQRMVCEFMQCRTPETGQRHIIDCLMNVTDDQWSSFGYRFNEVKS